MKPIIFSTSMVRALLNTKPYTWPAKPIDPEKPYKCMTRRLVKPQPDPDDDYINGVTVEGFQTALYQADEYWLNTVEGESIQVKPRYEKCDILWVKETFTSDNQGNFIYKADPMFEGCGPGDIGWKWTPSIFMPRKASRIFLEVKSVMVEHLRKITPVDCVNEGSVKKPHYMIYGGDKCLVDHKRYKAEFAKLWDSINAKRGYSWESNPWVWVYEFMRIEKETV